METEYNFTVKELPANERPREKLIKSGAEQLSNAELLALIIRTGNREKTAIELAQDILNHFGGLRSLIDLSVEEMKGIRGVGIAKGTQIRALIELSKRINSVRVENRVTIKNPKTVANLVMPDLRYSQQEIFQIVLLDTKNQVIATPTISKGGLTTSIVHPREVFKEAIRRSSSAIILIHNHPSGVPDPSQNDINITERLIEAGEIIGIDVLDHIIIGDGVYVSMKEQELI